MKASSFYCSLMKNSFSDHGGIGTCGTYFVIPDVIEC